MHTIMFAMSLLTGAPNPAVPPTKTVPVTDDYFGTKIDDPYRWLEDDNSAETAAWVEAQNKVSFEFLKSIPAREAIKARMTKLWSFERYSVPETHGPYTFFERNDGLQNQSVVYVQEGQGAPRVLLDPNTMAADGTIALSSMAFTDDGRLMAYGFSESGSDWVKWRVRDVATGKDLPDELNWTKFTSAAWLKDGSGFFYGRYAEPDAGQALKGATKNQKLYFHKLGTAQKDDTLVYERKDKPDWMFGAEVTDDGAYLVMSQHESTDRKNRVWVKSLDPKAKDAPFVPLFDKLDASYSVVATDKDTFWVLTDKDAPRSRLVQVDVKKPAAKQWKTILSEAKGSRDVLVSVVLAGERFVASWRSDAHETLHVYGLDGKHETEIALPAIGSVGAVSGKRASNDVYYSFTSFTQPTAVYKWDIKAKAAAPWKTPKVDFNPADYETKQVFYPSKDGTKIPMFIVHKRGLKLDGNNPTYLYGYGGFMQSLTPAFAVDNLVWMEMGGVYAHANLRGGGEYGTAWHDAGRLANKQNVFDDFIAAAEWLIANKYTQPSKLAIGGRSNGGLLVGATMLQRPELFGAALPGVGVLDMLRFHKFTIGWAWKSDYGSSETKDGFATLIKYSPLHNLKPGSKYPATLITTGDHDDRVVPAHSFKFAAALQKAQAAEVPTLIRIDVKAGHGAGKPTAKKIAERSDLWAFLVKVLDFKPTLP